MIVTKGTRIICPNGHICGCVTRDVGEDSAIQSGDLRIMGGTDATREGHVGHVCAKDGCGMVIAEAGEGRFRIRTVSGWVGRLE